MHRLLLSFFLLSLLSLGACTDPTFYWHRTQNHPDIVPDVVRAQSILEDDLAACTVETDAHNLLAGQNDPVSTEDGSVVDDKGSPRRLTTLPSVYELEDCMGKRGWVKVKNYYTIPY